MTNSAGKSQIDLTYLKNMSDGDEGFIKSMLESFLTTVPDILENLQNYHKEEKWDNLAKELHKLKPTLKYLGVNSLSDLMPTTEANCRVPHNFDQIGQGVNQIVTVTGSVLKEARSIFDS